MKKLFVLALLPMVAACATPQEKCIRTNSRDLNTVTKLIKETEGNLDRGYAIDRYEVTVPDWVPCTRYHTDANGAKVPVSTTCRSWTTEERTRPRTLDLAQEAVKLKQLKVKQGELSIRTQSAVAQCRNLYPE